jgi:hypothetical protein
VDVALGSCVAYLFHGAIPIALALTLALVTDARTPGDTVAAVVQASGVVTSALHATVHQAGIPLPPSLPPPAAPPSMPAVLVATRSVLAVVVAFVFPAAMLWLVVEAFTPSRSKGKIWVAMCLVLALATGAAVGAAHSSAWVVSAAEPWLTWLTT